MQKKKEHFKSEMILKDYQKTHNLICSDFANLLKLTLEQQHNNKLFKTLYRICLQELCSLIESDLSNINKLGNYYDFKESNEFIDDFKKTFVQKFKTWGEEKIQKGDVETKLDRLKSIKEERDTILYHINQNIIDPVTLENFNRIKVIFDDYENLIHELLSKFNLNTEFNKLTT